MWHFLLKICVSKLAGNLEKIFYYHSVMNSMHRLGQNIGSMVVKTLRINYSLEIKLYVRRFVITLTN